MQTARKKQQKQSGNDTLDVQKLLALLAEKDQQIEQKDQLLSTHQKHLKDKERIIRDQQRYIALVEEQLRLATIRKFAASSEKMAFQRELFDEAELEVTLSELEEQLPDDDSTAPRKKKKRKRGFSENLQRVQIRLTLSEEDKQGALKTFFSKVKEELDIIPAQARVLEYWQEKAVFESDNGEQHVIGAKRQAHPLGKSFASVRLLAYIIASKYADGLPLYRLERILERYGGNINRTNMANWIIRLEDVFMPLLNLMRECQLEGDYLQADESRLQVLKETGKAATSDKWMWVVRGGPPDKPSVLFEYDPSRSEIVPERLFDGFGGVLQVDGYAGYNKVCRKNGITRIGCWDHCRRKYVEAIKAAGVKKKNGKAGKPSKADVALGKINKLYALERQFKDLDDEQRRQARENHSLPKLAELKDWVEKNINRVPKGGLTHKAMSYTLNQWETLTGYCEDGRLHISNALAENAIRPFAVGRRAWLFADTPKGARASASCFSLVETAKANGLEPYAYLEYVLQRIAAADTLEKLEALLPWNTALVADDKKD